MKNGLSSIEQSTVSTATDRWRYSRLERLEEALIDRATPH